MKFQSTKYKGLQVHDLGVKFVDGIADVTDRKAIAGLRKLPPELGVRPLGEDGDDSGEGTGDGDGE